MIRYALHCAAGHDFESWFASASAFETLQTRGMVACAICGSTTVEKALMAPSVSPGSRQAGAAPDAGPATRGALSTPANPAEAAMAALRREIEANSEYVGVNFASEARRIHDGIVPGRAIYGEARPEEARQLIEDGVAVTPLPFMPARKTS